MFKEESQSGRRNSIYRRKGNVIEVGSLCKKSLLSSLCKDSVSFGNIVNGFCYSRIIVTSMYEFLLLSFCVVYSIMSL